MNECLKQIYGYIQMFPNVIIRFHIDSPKLFKLPDKNFG